MNLLSRSASLALFVALAAAAPAALTITLDSSTISAVPGGNAIFSGTLSNDQSLELFLDSVDFNLDGDAGIYLGFLDFDEDPFFSGTVPLSLLDARDIYSGPLFGLKIDPSSPAGLYTGTATITAHYDGQSSFTTDASIAVDVQAVPEPASMLALAGGVAALMRRRRRSRRSG